VYVELSAEAYFYGLRNFVHFHGQHHLDIRLSKSDQERSLQTGKALEHQYAPQAGWVSRVLETNEELENVKQLIKQALIHLSHRAKVNLVCRKHYYSLS